MHKGDLEIKKVLSKEVLLLSHSVKKALLTQLQMSGPHSQAQKKQMWVESPLSDTVNLVLGKHSHLF